MPKARLTIITMPKWIGSMPKCIATGTKMGASTMMAALVSMNMPMTNKAKLMPINKFVTYSAIAMGIAQIFFLINFFKTIFGKNVPQAEQNPWQVGTLEWEIPSPAPHYNFKEIPHVKCGPHELGNPNLTTGRDFQYQTEELVKA